MKIIDASAYLAENVKGREQKPTINFNKQKITLTRKAVSLLKTIAKHGEYKHNDKDVIYLLFAQDDEGQLHVTLTSEDDTRGLRVVQSATSTYQGGNKGLVSYFNGLIKSSESKFKFMISNAVKDGWFPVITNYK